uniref:Methyltransferase 22, Kin17 lysine n=1 Tax=Cyprinodon variegatus TaxID=28743 RepID=A0A3Q2GBT8_CYPVA
MDQITFQHDTVLSDVHMHRPNTRHLMTRLSAVGQPVFMSRFRILAEGRDEGGCEDKLRRPRSDDDDDDEEEGYGDEEPLLDEDGDLDVQDQCVCVIYFSFSDVGEDLLRLCNRNVCLNKHILEPAGGKVKVKRLDWLQHSLCTDADGEFSWTEEEVADLYDNASFILAADVCYDDDLTDGLFRTLYRLCSSFRHAAAIFISLEKRMNFSLRHMDVCCEAYNHFMHCLSQLQDLQDGRWRFMVELVPLNFPQFLLYERIEQLVREVLLKRFNSVSVPDKAGDGDL